MDITLLDICDIAIAALLLFYTYRIMKESGALNLFFGVLAFVGVWIIASQVLDMKLIGTVLNKFMSIGLLILVILFPDQIKRFLVQLGDHKRWGFIRRIFRMKAKSDNSEEGALIVIEQSMPLEAYENSGDIIDAKINSRLIENIFFKNSPLHDGALIIARNRLVSAGCILPVSHDTSVPRHLGLRHRSALGISQATDAVAVVVSEETGHISIARHGKLTTRLSNVELERELTEIFPTD